MQGLWLPARKTDLFQVCYRADPSIMVLSFDRYLVARARGYVLRKLRLSVWANKSNSESEGLALGPGTSFSFLVVSPYFHIPRQA